MLAYSTGPIGLILYFIFSMAGAYWLMYIIYLISFWTEQPFEEQQKTKYPWIMIGGIGVYFVLNFARVGVILYVFLASSTKMHKHMVEKVIRGKILFFDSHPVGRILTRFSKDISVFDILLPGIMIFAAVGLSRTISVMSVVVFVNPLMLIVIFISGILMGLLAKYLIQP